METQRKRIVQLEAELAAAREAINKARDGWMENEALREAEGWSKKLDEWLDLPAVRAAVEGE